MQCKCLLPDLPYSILLDLDNRQEVEGKISTKFTKLFFINHAGKLLFDLFLKTKKSSLLNEAMHIAVLELEELKLISIENPKDPFTEWNIRQTEKGKKQIGSGSHWVPILESSS